MKIKLIAENDKDRQLLDGDEVVHEGIKDYFLFGHKIDEDKDQFDFQHWNGQPRYLMSSLHYFYEQLNDDRRREENARPSYLDESLEKAMVKDTGTVIEFPMKDLNADNKSKPMIKRGAVQVQDVQDIDLTNIAENLTEKEENFDED